MREMKMRKEIFKRVKNKVKSQIGKRQLSGFKLLTNYYPKDAEDQVDDIFKIIKSELTKIGKELTNNN